MTASEIQARILKRIDDDAVSPATATPAEVMAAINEGQELASLLTLCLEKTASWTIPASSPFLSVRGQFPDFLVPLRWQIGSTRVRPAGLKALRALNPNWQASPGTPTRYCTLGFNFWIVSPQPVGDTASNLTYARAPLQLVGDDFPEIPEQYHQNLVDYGVYRIRLKEGQQGLARGLKYFSRFLDGMTELGNQVRARSSRAGYDTLPLELAMADRSRLLKLPKAA